MNRKSGAPTANSHATYTVIGASGFIGSRIAGTLKHAGENCFAPAKGSDEVFHRDLGRIFYCAGLTTDYADRPIDTINAHVSYLAKILTEAKFERLVYLSSTRLYDGQLSGAEDAPLMLDPMHKRHLFDLSKALGENLCMTASEGRGRVARLSNVYDASEGASGFLSALLLRLKSERKFTLDSSPGFSRDYISIDDVVVGLKAILDADLPHIVNLASGENVSNQDLADCLNAAGCDIRFQDDKTASQQPVICNITKLRGLHVNPVPVRKYLEFFMKSIHGNTIP